jgi:hypothetical protein
MKQYRCHKVVAAFKIAAAYALAMDPTAGIKSAQWMLLSGGSYPGEPLTFEIVVSDEWILNRVSPGMSPTDGYFVCYKDGYQSWSPAKEFEDGYSELEAYEAKEIK